MIDIGLDRYDRNARLKPALLALLPLMLVVAVWLRDVWTAAAGLVSLVVFCGLLYLLSRIARQRGRVVQSQLEKALGGLPTTINLRHRDRTIDAQTKERYHALLRSRGLRVPSELEEQLNPTAADGEYRSCVTWLLEATRDRTRFKMIRDENIDYGFRRNLLGLKHAALFIVGLSLCANTIAITVRLMRDDRVAWDGISLELVLVLIAIAWVLVINLDFVVDAARSYSQRLLAACDIVAAP